jgi:hypothetical protein
VAVDNPQKALDEINLLTLELVKDEPLMTEMDYVMLPDWKPRRPIFIYPKDPKD